MSRYFFKKWFSAALGRLHERGLLQEDWRSFNFFLNRGQAEWDAWSPDIFPNNKFAKMIKDRQTLVDIYVAMYGSWHYFQFSELLSDLELNPISRENDFVLIDIGAGPGTAIVACLDFDLWQKFQQILAYDRSKVMCDYAIEFFESVYKEIKTKPPEGNNKNLNRIQVFQSTFGTGDDSVTSEEFLQSLRENAGSLNGKYVKICLSFIIANKSGGENVRLSLLDDFISMICKTIEHCLYYGASSVQLICQNPTTAGLDGANNYFDTGLKKIQKTLNKSGLYNTHARKKTIRGPRFDWYNLKRLFMSSTATGQPRISAAEAIENMDFYGYSMGNRPTAWSLEYRKTPF